MQRKQYLRITGEPYICCGGMCPCCCFGEPQDSNCVWLEACCCLGVSISANRFLIQTRFDKRNTACDDCLLWTTCIVSTVVDLLRCCGFDVPEEIVDLVDCINMTVNGCMLAQQQVELDYIEKTGWAGANPNIVALLKPNQQQMISQGRPTGAVGAGMVVGSAFAGGAGAAAVGGALGGGYPGMAPQQVMPMGSGFMATRAPNGLAWAQCVQGQQPIVDPGSGFIVGPWGECLAWAKVFEAQNPGWESNPQYAEDGPCGQVIAAMLNTVPGQFRQQVESAANRLEQACENAAQMRQPLPLINAYA